MLLRFTAPLLPAKTPRLRSIPTVLVPPLKLKVPLLPDSLPMLRLVVTVFVPPVWVKVPVPETPINSLEVESANVMIV